MSNLFAYVKRIAREKREFNQKQERAKALPKDYAYVYHKIQRYMWGHSWKFSGVNITPILDDLLDLFETGAAEGRRVLDITGEDVAAFCDDLLRNAGTSEGIGHEVLNRDIMKKLGKGNGS